MSAKFQALREKLGAIVIKIPMVGHIRPFGPMVGKAAFLTDEEARNHELIKEGNEKKI